MRFSARHATMLCEYAGISFVAGAVNHGFFSGERSLVTAALGVGLYLIGALIERRTAPDGGRAWGDFLSTGILLSIGIGFFTGGLQHFPDSPVRSAWVVPAGFLMSLVALYLSPAGRLLERRGAAVYGVAAGVPLLAACVGSAIWLQSAGGGSDAHSHDHDHGAPQAAAAGTTTAAASAHAGHDAAIRTILVELDDTMRFHPDALQVREGETVRFVAVNNGKVRHEMVLGDSRALADHAASMLSGNSAHHAHDNAISLAPGEARTLLYTFAKQGMVSIACFEPGHFEAGMKGSISVRPG
jgi:uncharacterized cupredoxin-like copper-binding protein